MLFGPRLDWRFGPEYEHLFTWQAAMSGWIAHDLVHRTSGTLAHSHGDVAVCRRHTHGRWDAKAWALAFRASAAEGGGPYEDLIPFVSTLLKTARQAFFGEGAAGSTTPAATTGRAD